MIISHRYKYIFIKTNKTAGTSIEIALSKHCGPEDIITPISSVDEITRKELGYPGPQNHVPNKGSRNLLDRLLRRKRNQKKSLFFNHMSAENIKALVDEDVWNNYYKFCVERNPWDRVVSLYYWKNKTEPRPTLAKFIASQMPLHLKHRGIELYTIDGQVVVDKVCRFENLNEDLEAIRIKLGIPDPLVLPRAKAQHRTDKRPYRELFGDQERAEIEKLFSDEIKLFGYTF